MDEGGLINIYTVSLTSHTAFVFRTYLSTRVCTVYIVCKINHAKVKEVHEDSTCAAAQVRLMTVSQYCTPECLNLKLSSIDPVPVYGKAIH